MFPKFKKLSLEKQLFICFLSVSAVLLTLSLGITLSFNLNRSRREIDKGISNLAAYIASMDNVREMLELGYPPRGTKTALDTLHESFPDISVIVIYNAEGLRFYHTNRQESGETLVDGEEKAILAGSPPYITTGIGSHGSQRRAFHAVKRKDGTIIGFVMTSVFTSYIADQARALIPVYSFIMVVMLTVSVLISRGILHLLRDSLMGHHPNELLQLYLQQDSILNAMSEGIVASDLSGTIVFANQNARSLFPDRSEITGIPLTDLFSETSFSDIMKTGDPVSGKSCQISGHPILCNELPIKGPKEIHGVLSIFNDQYELERLSDELSGARSMLDTLRAFNHEFLNKLHVILGYLQTGQTDQAIAFITNSNLVSSQAIRQTADCLRVSQICALVIGKMMHAAELGILLSVTPDSRCKNSDLTLPMDSYITIIGNLLENAIEELSASNKDIREIILGIYANKTCTIITCEDTGRGIRKDLLPNIYDLGVSSKGKNRGTGLYLIHQIVEMNHGEIAIETEEGEGTCFTLTFTGKEIS